MSGHDHGAGGFEQLARQYWAAFANLARGEVGGARGDGGGNPFAGPANPFATGAFAQNPFAAAASNPFAATNPFAAAGHGGANPFASNPFAAPGAMPGWKEGLEFWTQFVTPGSGQLDAALQRMNAQSADWFGLMQQLAGGFAGQDARPDQIAAAWQQMLGNGLGQHGIVELFKRMAGPGAQGFEQWLAQIQPWMAMLQPQFGMPPMPAAGTPQQQWHDHTATTLRMPTFGLAREHQARWQGLMQAVLDYQQANTAFNELLLRVAQRAFERFETRLEERAEPGRQLDSARALFDLWIDAAEDAWQQIALGEEFRGVYGRLANTQMRLRGAVQTEIEHMASALGLPSRTEMDASHRKVAALEREVRRMQRERTGSSASPRARPPRPEAMPARASNDEVADAAPPAPTPKKRAMRARSEAKATQRAAQPAAKPRKAQRKAQPRKRQTATLPTVTAPRALDRRAPRADAGTKKKARK